MNSGMFIGILGLLESKLLEAHLDLSHEPVRLREMNLWGVAANIMLTLMY